MSQGLLDLSTFEIILSEHAKLQGKEVGNTSSRVFGDSGVIRTVRNSTIPPEK